MRLFRTIRLAWTFYRGFLLLSLLITAVCCRLFWLYSFAAFFGIFWCKLITLAVTFYFINDAKQREYYYYYNLGVSKRLLWTVTVTFDFLLFLFLLILIHYMK